jgi:hypothetical protein
MSTGGLRALAHWAPISGLIGQSRVTPSDLISCPECGEGFDKSQMADPEQHLSLNRELICMNCHRDWVQIEDLRCRGCNSPMNSEEAGDQR